MTFLAQNDLPGAEILDPRRYGTDGFPYDDFKRLRHESPVHWCGRERGEPFWAITKHADIVWISGQPDVFSSEPRLFVSHDPGISNDDVDLRMMISMDNPEHTAYRNLINRRFTPRALRDRIERRVDAIVEEILGNALDNSGDGEIDFVDAISAKLPIWVIGELLGVPEEDWDRMYHWTNYLIGSADPEFQEPGSNQLATITKARGEMFEYFTNLAAARRKNPKDDLISVLANAQVNGSALPPLELLSYYALLVTAGNETTRNATTGGLLALIEHPALFEQVRSDAGLIPSFVEETLRWVTPLPQFVRTLNRDVELHGQKMKEGQRVVLFYPSGNRDEDVFENPDEFRLDRHPNRHITFGSGEHFCLGAHLARMELRVVFTHMLERFESVELAGPIERMQSSIVNGIKRMPLRYQLRTNSASATGVR